MLEPFHNYKTLSFLLILISPCWIFFYFEIIVIYQVRVAQLVKVLDLNQNIPALSPRTNKYVYANSHLTILSSITTFSSFLKHLLYTNFTHFLQRPWNNISRTVAQNVRWYSWRGNVMKKYKSFWTFDGETLFLKNKFTCFKSCHFFKLFWWNFVYASSCFEFCCNIQLIFSLNFNLLLSKHWADNCYCIIFYNDLLHLLITPCIIKLSFTTFYF